MTPVGRGHLEGVEITKRYAGLVANDAVEIEVRAGEVVGLIGPNGAGKTTLFDCLTGFTPVTSGRAADARLRIYRPNDTTGALPSKPEPPKSLPGETSPQGAMELPPTHEVLVALADALALLKAWPITIEDMQEQEKAMLRQRFTGLYEEDLLRLVDDRYEEYLEEEPQVDPRLTCL